MLLLVDAEATGSHGLLGVMGASLSSGVVNEILPGCGVVEDALLLLRLLLLILLLTVLGHGSLSSNLLLHSLDLLRLLVQSHLVLDKLGLVEVELLELLSGGLHIPKLLLETLLLLSQVHVGSHELSVDVWVHLLVDLVVEHKLGGSQYLVDSVLLTHLLAHHVLLLLLLLLHVVVLLRLALLTLLLLGAVLGESSLGLVVVDVGLAKTLGVGSEVVPGVLLRGTVDARRLRAERGRGGSLGGSPKPVKQMRAAGAGGGHSIFLVAALVETVKGERLDVVTTAARG